MARALLSCVAMNVSRVGPRPIITADVGGDAPLRPPPAASNADVFERGGTATPFARPPPFDTSAGNLARNTPSDLAPGVELEWPADVQIEPGGGDCNVGQMSFGDKVGEVLQSAAQHLGPEALETLKQNLPGALLGLGAFAAAHAAGIGFIADAVGAGLLGAEAGRLVGDAIDIAKDFSNAKCHSDLDRVGQKLARLASEGGFDLLLGLLGKKLGERGVPGEPDGLRKGADPVGEKFGPGRLSHPEEWDASLEALRQAGVEVEFRPGQMWYGPAPTAGRPGKLILDPDASIAALPHEMQHVADDQALGYPGMRAMTENPNIRYQYEVNGYEREIEFAREQGDEELVRALEALREEERRAIFGE